MSDCRKLLFLEVEVPKTARCVHRNTYKEEVFCNCKKRKCPAEKSVLRGAWHHHYHKAGPHITFFD